MPQIRSCCRLCPALRGALVKFGGDEVLRVTGDPEHSLLEGYTCVKGRSLSRRHNPRHLGHPMLGRGMSGLAPTERGWTTWRTGSGGSSIRTGRTPSGPVPRSTPDLAVFVGAIGDAGHIAVDTGTGLTMTASANKADWVRWALLVLTDSLNQPGGSCHPWYLHSWGRTEVWASDGRPRPGPRSRSVLPGRLVEQPSAISDETEAGFLRVLAVVGGIPVGALPGTDHVVKALHGLEVLAVARILDGSAVDVLPSTGLFERTDLPVFDAIFSEMTAQYTPAAVSPAGKGRPVWWPDGQVAVRFRMDVLGGRDPDACTDDDVLRTLTRRARAPFESLRRPALPLADEMPSHGSVRDRVLPQDRWAAGSRAARRTDGGAPRGRRRASHSSAPTESGQHALRGRDPARQSARRGPGPHHYGRRSRRSIAAGRCVRVATATGVIEARAESVSTLRPGVVSVRHGFVYATVSELTDAVDLDPLSGMPRHSGAPVEVILALRRR